MEKVSSGQKAGTIETEVLIALMRAALNQEEAPDFPPSCSTEKLMKLILRQRLLTFVYPVIAEAEMKSEGYHIMAETLKESYMRAFQRGIHQEYEITKWLQEAEKAGLDCLPLKGWILRNLYPESSMRSMADFDVLLNNMDPVFLKPWMEQMGYEADHISEESCHDNYIKQPFMNIEVHRRLISPQDSSFFWFENLWERLSRSEACEHIWQMSKEDFYIYMLIHMKKHFSGVGTGMRGIADIYVYLRAHKDSLDRQYLNRELKKLGLEKFASYMEYLADIWFGVGVPDEDSRLVTDYFAESGMYGIQSRYKVREVSGDQGSTYWVNKLRIKLKIIFPGVDCMKVRFPRVEKYPFLLPAYWVIRIFRVIFFDREKVKALDYHQVSGNQCRELQYIYTIAGV